MGVVMAAREVMIEIATRIAARAAADAQAEAKAMVVADDVHTSPFGPTFPPPAKATPSVSGSNLAKKWNGVFKHALPSALETFRGHCALAEEERFARWL